MLLQPLFPTLTVSHTTDYFHVPRAELSLLFPMLFSLLQFLEDLSDILETFQTARLSIEIRVANMP